MAQSLSKPLQVNLIPQLSEEKPLRTFLLLLQPCLLYRWLSAVGSLSLKGHTVEEIGGNILLRVKTQRNTHILEVW